jgi:hypothetical protein
VPKTTYSFNYLGVRAEIPTEVTATISIFLVRSNGKEKAKNKLGFRR